MSSISWCQIGKWTVALSTSNAILSAASDSVLKLFEEWYNTCVLNFSASDFRVDPTDSACVDTDSSSLCDIFANMHHITAKDAVEGIVNINQNA